MSFFALNLWHEQRTWKIVSQYQGRLFLLNSLQNKKLTLLGSCLKTDWMLSEAYINGKQALAQWLINPLLPPKNCWAEGKATIRTAVLEKKRQVSNKLRFCSLPLDSRIFMTSDISEFCRSFHFTFNKHLPGLSVFSRKRKKKREKKQNEQQQKKTTSYLTAFWIPCHIAVPTLVSTTGVILVWKQLLLPI